ncbi:MAG: hypothetical protein ACYS0D_16535 [Planctomycetota bacterium]
MSLESLYENKGRLREWLGDSYTPPEKFKHGIDTLVAELPAKNEDGYQVSVFEVAMPARFYRVKALRRGRTFTLETGSSQEGLVAHLAKALTGGMLDLGMEASAGDLAVELDAATRRISGLEAEVERLAGWLREIEGGDSPCTDEGKLRQWAYEALVLNREVPA